MIDKKELRIGNLIHGTRHYTHKISEITEWGVGLGGDCKIYYEDIFPIKLTDDIMVKLGFMDCDYHEFICDITGLIFKYTGKGYTYYAGEYNIVTVYNVHQLQNLYFAIEKMELDVTNVLTLNQR